jgi:hypothetical protein
MNMAMSLSSHTRSSSVKPREVVCGDMRIPHISFLPDSFYMEVPHNYLQTSTLETAAALQVLTTEEEARCSCEPRQLCKKCCKAGVNTFACGCQSALELCRIWF